MIPLAITLISTLIPNYRLTVSWMLQWHNRCHLPKFDRKTLDIEGIGPATESFFCPILGPDMFECIKANSFTIIKNIPIYILNWNLSESISH